MTNGENGVRFDKQCSVWGLKKWNIDQARRKHFLSGTAIGEGSVGSGDPSARSAEKFFTFIFQLSGLALVASLCFALHCQGRT